MEPVGLGPRILAGLIDIVIMLLIIMPLSFMAGQSTGAQIGVYFIVMEALKGATVGKMAMGLRVVKAADGSAISWMESIIRNVLRIVDALPFLYILGMILIAVTAKKQRVGDLAASTIVVKKAA
jgi:uncharacterized RDD family membrane protein YckC